MKCLLVDDEALARDRLRRLLASLRPELECLEAADAVSALELAARERPEIAILDIRMPGMDGLELASRLNEQAAPPAVLFSTAYDEYALDALRRAAVGYLLKPVRAEELAGALEQAARPNRAQLAVLRGEEAGRAVLTSTGHGRVASVPVDEVRCLLAEQKYVAAHAPGQVLLLEDTLKDLEREFPGRFLRVHRNALVAAAHVDGLERHGAGWRVRLRGIDLAPGISRRHLAGVKGTLTGS